MPLLPLAAARASIIYALHCDFIDDAATPMLTLVTSQMPLWRAYFSRHFHYGADYAIEYLIILLMILPYVILHADYAASLPLFTATMSFRPITPYFAMSCHFSLPPLILIDIYADAFDVCAAAEIICITHYADYVYATMPMARISTPCR